MWMLFTVVGDKDAHDDQIKMALNFAKPNQILVSLDNISHFDTRLVLSWSTPMTVVHLKDGRGYLVRDSLLNIYSAIKEEVA